MTVLGMNRSIFAPLSSIPYLLWASGLLALPGYGVIGSEDDRGDGRLQRGLAPVSKGEQKEGILPLTRASGQLVIALHHWQRRHLAGIQGFELEGPEC